MEYIAVASAAISLVEMLIPKIKEAFQKGEITAEQQQELMDKYSSLRDKADEHFSGPEWEKSGR